MNDKYKVKVKVKVTQFISQIKDFASYIKNKILKDIKYRFSFLFLSVILGVLLAKCLYQPMCEFITNDCKKLSLNPLLIALMALPTTAVLWFFRTHDTRENIHQNDLFDALKMLTDDILVRREIATQRLISLGAKVPEYKEDIKLAFIKVLKSFPKTTTMGVQSEESERRTYAQYMLQWLSIEYTAKELNLDCSIFDLQDFTIAKDKPDFFKLFVEGDFKNVSFNSADLKGADLRHANLRGADLRHADLWHANLRGADLRHANLSSASLRHADLRHANLSSANLSSADLSDADLRGVDLSDANLRNADLKGANLKG